MPYHDLLILQSQRGNKHNAHGSGRQDLGRELMRDLWRQRRFLVRREAARAVPFGIVLQRIMPEKRLSARTQGILEVDHQDRQDSETRRRKVEELEYLRRNARGSLCTL